MRRFYMVLTLIAGLVFLYAVWRLQGAVKLAKDPDAMARELFPQPGPPNQFDRHLLDLTETLEKLPPSSRQSLWNISDPKNGLTLPDLADVEEALSQREELRSQALALPSDLYPEGDSVVLQTSHNLRLNRELQGLLSEECLNLLLTRRSEEALKLLEVKEKLAQLLTRGISNNSSLIARMMGVAFLTYGTRVALNAQEYSLLTDQERRRTVEILQAGLDHEVPLSVSVQSELDIAARAVNLVDRNLGLLQYPLRLYWGNGQEQVEQLRKRWKDGWTNLEEREISRLHIMIQISLPNLEKAEERVHESQLARRQMISSLGVQ